MAGPPRFTSMPSMGNGGGFRMNFGGAPQPLIGMPMRPPPTNLAPSAGGGGPPKNSQVTTVFVGNISEKADNEFVKQMLMMCGKVVAWKRMAGVSGKLQGFGFCDFEEPEDTLRALRVLNDFQLGDKKLIVKVEQKHRDQLKAFAEKEAGQPAKPNSEELPASEKSLRKDENVRLKILEVIEKDYPDLVKFEDGEVDDKDKDGKLKDAKKEVEESKDRKGRSKRSRSRSGSRSRSPARRGRRSRSPRNKRRRRSSRSSSRSSSDSRSSRSSSRSSSYDSRDRKKRSRRSRSASRATYASDDSEDAREKRAIKRQIKEKEMAYAARLREWEGREKKMSKKYEKDESKEKSRKLDVNKEAKKLKAFLEDYDDEKDDPKYYKSSSLFARRRDFEREKGTDERDRLLEQAEIEELKRQIVEESKAKVKQEEMEMETKEMDVEEEARRRHEQQEAAARAKHQRDGSGSPNPHQPLGQRRRANGDGGSSSSESGSEDDEEKAEDENDVVKEGQKWSTFGATDSPAGSGVTSSPLGGASASPATGASATRSPLITSAPIRLTTLKTGAASVFGGEEDDEDSSMIARKKLKPFEITQEERLKTMTSGEIKKLQKEIADTIPADKEALFEFEVKREHLTKGEAMGRVKNWITKKIKEYIGEEDQSLIQFICEKVTSGASPAKIQDDLAMIIDNEAAAFTIKLWRLVIYETECASRGLPQATAATR